MDRYKNVVFDHHAKNVTRVDKRILQDEFKHKVEVINTCMGDCNAADFNVGGSKKINVDINGVDGTKGTNLITENIVNSNVLNLPSDKNDVLDKASKLKSEPLAALYSRHEKESMSVEPTSEIPSRIPDPNAPGEFKPNPS